MPSVYIDSDTINTWLLYTTYIVMAVISLMIVCYLIFIILKQCLYWKFKHVDQELPKPIFGNIYQVVMGKKSLSLELDRLFHLEITEEDVPLGYHEFLTPMKIWRRRIQLRRFMTLLTKRPIQFSQSADPLWAKSIFAMCDVTKRNQMKNLCNFSSILQEQNAYAEFIQVQIVTFIENSITCLDEVDLKNMFLKLTNRILAHCFFDFDCFVSQFGEDIINKYLYDYKCDNFRGHKNHLKYLIYANFPKLARFLNLGFIDKQTTNYFKAFVNASTSRNTQHITSRLMYAYKINIPDQEYQNERTEIIAAQVALCFIKGSDAISTALTFIFYELVQDPELETRIYNHVNEYWNPETAVLDTEKIHEMNTLLERFIKDVLRKWPPVSILEKYEPNLGFCVQIPVYSIHNDRRFYYDFEKINPDRVDPEDEPLLYLSFGHGSEKCEGQALTILIMKYVIIYMLKAFKFTACSKTEVPLTFSTKERNIYPANGIYLNMQRRIHHAENVESAQ